MDTPSSNLVIRDWPVTRWVIGLGLILLAAFNLIPTAFASGAPALVIRGILAIGGLGLVLLAPVLTVTADRLNRMLTLHSRSLLKGSHREIPFSQIEAIQLEIHQERSHSSSEGGPTYRIVVILKDGEVVPFHSFYSSGSGDKTRKVKKLREFIGVGGSEMGMGLMGTLREINKIAQVELQKKQEALTGSQDEIHVTDGVHWQVQTSAFGGTAVTRWYSPDYRAPGGFVYFSQLVEGQKAAAGGWLGGLSATLYKQAMTMYGFYAADLPGIESAELFDPLDPGLESAFSIYTSVPHIARKLLTPRVVAALSDWNRRYPLKKVHVQELFSQLVVMFSPQGVYVASIGTMIPEAIEEMTRLGVELIQEAGCNP